MGERIAHFLNPFDYELCLQKYGATDTIQILPLIQAIAYHPKVFQLPKKFQHKIFEEQNLRVKLTSFHKDKLMPRQGIPWGVQHIQAPKAWEKTKGEQVKVGVIDTGVDYSHPDLSLSVAQGINLINRMDQAHDDNGHGTHIAGTIAAANTVEGIIGVAPLASLYPVKAFDCQGAAYVSDIILAIEWCVLNKMNIINMSFGMKKHSRALFNAVHNAYQAGILIIASSGNEGRVGHIDFPAAYRETIAVSATNRKQRIAKFANRSSKIDIFAPGEQILSTWLKGKHRRMNGTSMATCHVTGAVALLLAYKPYLNPLQITNLLKRSARTIIMKKAPKKIGELQVMKMLKTTDQCFNL